MTVQTLYRKESSNNITMKILQVNNLCKTYGTGETQVNALKNVSFSLEKGTFCAVVGESGSGKSTLLNCIGALDTPTSGEIRIDGHNLFALKEKARTIFRRRNIGFIFQSFQLVAELTVEQNIIFPLLLDYSKPDAAAVEEMLEILGLQDRRRHLPNQLSGGQQQRVAIGRALITKPKLILADEPTGNLDSRNSQEVLDLLIKASRHYQQTILMITHNNALAASADNVLRVADGCLSGYYPSDLENTDGKEALYRDEKLS
jgi:putative ABC transport system ATP-binding protein